MIRILFFLLFTLTNQISLGQISSSKIIFAKEYSKEIALYRAKTFVIEDILGETSEVLKFEIDPIAAATSGELTTLIYKCEEKNKSGLIIGFFGYKWNSAGVTFQAYAFKSLPLTRAKEFLNKIEIAIKENSKYLKDDLDNNNIYFQFEDITILISNGAYGSKLRIYWDDFDSAWDFTEFEITKKRLLKKLK